MRTQIIDENGQEHHFENVTKLEYQLAGGGRYTDACVTTSEETRFLSPLAIINDTEGVEFKNTFDGGLCVIEPLGPLVTCDWPIDYVVHDRALLSKLLVAGLGLTLDSVSPNDMAECMQLISSRITSVVLDGYIVVIDVVGPDGSTSAVIHSNPDDITVTPARAPKGFFAVLGEYRADLPHYATLYREVAEDV